MTINQLTEAALHRIWSAIHYINEPNHSGKQISELFKKNAESQFQKTLFNEFETKRDFSQAEIMMTEMENLLIGNTALQGELTNLLNSNKGESTLPLPPIARTAYPEEIYQQSNEGSGVSAWSIFIAIIIILRVILLIARLSR